MKLSDKGFEFLKGFEGFAHTVYKCPAGHPSIGIGHKLTAAELETGTINIGGSFVKWVDGLSDDQILTLADQDIALTEKSINSCVKVPLTQNQFDVLVDFIFNIGAGDFMTSTLLTRLNKKQYDRIPNELKRWCFVTVYGKKQVSPGLKNRRKKEAELWLSK